MGLLYYENLENIREAEEDRFKSTHNTREGFSRLEEELMTNLKESVAVRIYDNDDEESIKLGHDRGKPITHRRLFL